MPGRLQHVRDCLWLLRCEHVTASFSVQEDAPELFALLRGTGLLPHVGLLEVATVAPPPQVPRLLTRHAVRLLSGRQSEGYMRDKAPMSRRPYLTDSGTLSKTHPKRASRLAL